MSPLEFILSCIVAVETIALVAIGYIVCIAYRDDWNVLVRNDHRFD